METRYRALGGKTDALGGEEVMSVSDGILAAMEEINVKTRWATC